MHETRDALLLIEAARRRLVPTLTRRPVDKERPHLILSGNVFVYQEAESGIKRWTDGKNWSPSRIIGNTLIYRELEQGFPPGEKKKAMKRKRLHEDAGYRNRTDGLNLDDPEERLFVGSLQDSYAFKPGGLIKKTCTVKARGEKWHLISYYTVEDAKASMLHRPSNLGQFNEIILPLDLTECPSFRNTVDSNGVEIPRNGSPTASDHTPVNAGSASSYRRQRSAAEVHVAAYLPAPFYRNLSPHAQYQSITPHSQNQYFMSTGEIHSSSGTAYSQWPNAPRLDTPTSDMSDMAHVDPRLHADSGLGLPAVDNHINAIDSNLHGHYNSASNQNPFTAGASGVTDPDMYQQRTQHHMLRMPSIQPQSYTSSSPMMNRQLDHYPTIQAPPIDRQEVQYHTAQGYPAGPAYQHAPIVSHNQW